MDANIINVDIRNLNSDSVRIKDEIDEIFRLYNILKSSVKNLELYWNGNAQKIFSESINSDIDFMRALIENMRESLDNMDFAIKTYVESSNESKNIISFINF